MILNQLERSSQLIFFLFVCLNGKVFANFFFFIKGEKCDFLQTNHIIYRLEPVSPGNFSSFIFTWEELAVFLEKWAGQDFTPLRCPLFTLVLGKTLD